jgi:hypothetical protein
MTPCTGKEQNGQICDTACGPAVYLQEILGLSVRVATRRHGLSSDQLCDLVCGAAPESALTPENLRHLANDRPATFTNPLGLVVVLARLGESELLARMARAAGFVLVPATEGDGTEAGLLRAAAEYQRDVAETLTEVSKALADQKMTRKQASEILRELTDDEAKLAMLARSVRSALVQLKADA